MTFDLTAQDEAPRVAAFLDGVFVGWPLKGESDANCVDRLIRACVIPAEDAHKIEVYKACYCPVPQPIVDCTDCWPEDAQ